MVVTCTEADGKRLGQLYGGLRNLAVIPNGFDDQDIRTDQPGRAGGLGDARIDRGGARQPLRRRTCRPQPPRRAVSRALTPSTAPAPGPPTPRRPVRSAASSRARGVPGRHGQDPNGASIRKVTFIRLSSVTHPFNQNQRMNRLAFSATTSDRTVSAPRPETLLLPATICSLSSIATAFPLKARSSASTERGRLRQRLARTRSRLRPRMSATPRKLPCFTLTVARPSG